MITQLKLSPSGVEINLILKQSEFELLTTGLFTIIDHWGSGEKEKRELAEKLFAQMDKIENALKTMK